MLEFNAGCSAFSWETADGLSLWGRNFDFNRIAQGSKITYIPRGTEYYTRGTSFENNLRQEEKENARFSFLGMGSLLLQSTPTIFEGINEKGLMGGQLYFRKFASYKKAVEEDKKALQPAFVVTHILSQCENVEQVIDMFANKVTVIDEKIFGSLPTVHWMFTDSTGKSVIIEPEKDGLHIYEDNTGVMTNSPSYSWHLENLLNYCNLRQEDYADISLNGKVIGQCFSGTGMQGLPGDFSSTSRFVRLNFLKAWGQKGKDEEEGVSHMFRLFQHVAFPMGLVKVPTEEMGGERDENLSEYDYTLYTCVMCSQSLKYYWTTYDNPQIRCLDLRKLLSCDEIRQFELEKENSILYYN